MTQSQAGQATARTGPGAPKRHGRFALAAALLLAGFALSAAGHPAPAAASARSAAPAATHRAPAHRAQAHRAQAQGAQAHRIAIPRPASVPGAPGLGPNVYIFTPSMPQNQIQQTVDAIASQQVSNQFGTQRYALLFEPGTYGSAPDPLSFQVGYYTTVAGLGASPGDVVINGAVDAFNQCLAPGNCTALVNFWRSLSNLTINVTASPSLSGCQGSAEFWAVSQAAPMRRVDINGQLTLQDFCSSPGFSSGGFIADSRVSGPAVISGSQQQFLVRNSVLSGWSNGVWNQVFSGDVGAPAQSFGVPGGAGPYTTLAASPVTQEEPFLYTDSHGGFDVFVPAVGHDSSGITWGNGPAQGTSLPLRRFFVAAPSDPVWAIDAALARGQNLILTPGVYSLPAPIEVTHPGTIVLGLGFPTLVPTRGAAAMQVAGVPGVKLSGMIFDAGPVRSPVLLQVGWPGHGARLSRDPGRGQPTLVQDVFFRIGGATAGQATTSLAVDASNVILDDIWAWRADHGNGVGWTGNVGDTGVLVNGDDVTAYGLFVEHYQKNEVIWNGQGGTDIFFQNEMPYDPPSQAAWMSAPTTDGYPAFLITPRVRSFSGYGMGSYSFFNQGVDIHSATAFRVPVTPGVQLHDLLTIFLSTSGFGGIDHVVNDTGGSSTIANPDTPVTVINFP
jgi:hypothetical protein